MTSPVNWALLGLVIERPSYGHELYQRFQRVYAGVLPLSGESHVYAALNALEGRGLIAEIPGSRSGRQPKPRYQATQSGLDDYIAWLVAEVDAERRRQELWVRQLAIFANNPSTALDVLGRFERMYLKGAGRVGDRPGGSGVGSRDELIERLVGEHQRNVDGARIKWLGSARDAFEARAEAARDDAARP
ncbi:MAG TPA: helix-turn-helix transcriptional regulator [Solirubrobacteraceae bacterium]|nr:helix-turn-helix transcriptional regulator [Solirubrobacteraceae bacterium]